jgi:hypothetical protein
MAVEKYNAFWRKSLAIGILPFAALGVAGCDNTPTAYEDTTGEEGAIDGDPSVEGDRPENVEEVEEEEQVIEESLPVDG